jgi:hypothetical protein
VTSGLAQKTGDRRYQVDTAALLRAVIGKRTWADLGVKDIYGTARVVSTDPARSNSGYVFSGLAANALAGGVADENGVSRVRDDIAAVFAAMGFKSHSSGKLFEDYVAGGPGASPLVVGYENQLIEWILADRDRWEKIEQRDPTVFTAHPLLVLNERADAIIETLKSEEAQALAWRLNGFRGPLGSYAGEEDETIARYVQPSITSVVPMPDADAMDAITKVLSA